MNPKLFISNYYDEIINDIDLYTETYLLKLNDNPDEESQRVNKIRDDFIQEINSVKEKNIINYEINLQKQIVEIDENLHDLENVRSKIFKFNCVRLNLIENDTSFNLGIMLVTDWYLDKKQLNFLEKILNGNYQNDESNILDTVCSS